MYALFENPGEKREKGKIQNAVERDRGGTGVQRARRSGTNAEREGTNVAEEQKREKKMKKKKKKTWTMQLRGGW